MTKYCSHTFRKIISSYDWKNNSPIRTYWLRCKSCGHKWSVYFDKKLQREVEVSKMSDSRPLNNRRLTPAEVHKVLLDKRSNMAMAKELGISPQAVSQIRNGTAYKYLWPEVPRVPSSHVRGPSPVRPQRVIVKEVVVVKAAPKEEVLYCKNCTHWWQKKCGLDIPEAGHLFANDCSFYNIDD